MYWYYAKLHRENPVRILQIMGGNHSVTHDVIWYPICGHDNDNITIQQFCDYRYIAKQSYNDTSGYLTEEYKMQRWHEYRNFLCPVNVVKDEVGWDFRLESD